MNDKGSVTVGSRIAAGTFEKYRLEGKVSPDGTVTLTEKELAAVAAVGVQSGWDICWKRWQESLGRASPKERVKFAPRTEAHGTMVVTVGPRPGETVGRKPGK